MANVTGTIKTQTSTTQTPSTLPGSVTPLTINQNFSTAFTNGTTANSVDLKYTNTLALAAAAQTLDLSALTDVVGGAVNFARVRSITVKVRSTTDGQTCTLSPGASSGWTNLIGTGSTLILHASSTTNDAGLVIAAPNTTGWVVDGTHKTLKFDPGASTFSVDVEIMGASV